MKICLAAMTPDYSRREKQHSLAPYVLKRYADVHLDRSGVVIQVFDYNSDAPIDSIVEELVSQTPHIIGFSCYIWNYAEFIAVARQIKERAPQILLVFGGPMFSNEAECVVAKHAWIDIACHEVVHGEISFLHLLRALYDKSPIEAVPGIVFRSGETHKIVRTARRSEKIDRSSAVSPILSGDIPFTPKGSFVTIETARGCPFDCGYCGWGDGKIEYFPMERILEEIRVIYNNPDVKFVLFGDSNMAMNKSRLLEIVEHIQRQSQWKNIETYMYLYVTTLNGELVRELSVLPNFLFSFGMQTANPESLKMISSSRPTAQKFRDKIGEIRSEVPDFHFSLDLLLGLPGDSFSGFRQTLDFCFSLNAEKLIIVYPIFLLPGSRFFRDRETLGIEYGEAHPQAIISTPGFPRPDIEKAMRLAIWTVIITTYYPAIARFFRFLCKDLADGQRIELLEKWVQAADEGYRSFEGISFTNAAATSFKIIKGFQRDQYKALSQAQAAYKLYSVIAKLHDSNDPVFCSTIKLGMTVFEYYLGRNLNPCGKEIFGEILEKFGDQHSQAELSDVHSIYRL